MTTSFFMGIPDTELAKLVIFMKGRNLTPQQTLDLLTDNQQAVIYDLTSRIEKYKAIIYRIETALKS